MEKYYKFAGVEISVSLPDDKIYKHEGHLAAFRTEKVCDPYTFSFTLADSLPEPEGDFVAAPPGFRIYKTDDDYIRYIGPVADSWKNANACVACNGKKYEVALLSSVFTKEIGSKTILNSIGAEHLVAQNGGFVLHSSYIEVNGGAIVFTAPSGTGKSTQAELWKQFRGARIINGDRSVIRKEGDTYMVCGLPFAGSSEYCLNETLPLRAVVCIKQAKTTSIRKIGGYEAFSKIWEGASVNIWNKADVSAVSSVITELMTSVPVFSLECTPDESAVTALENAMKEVSVL